MKEESRELNEELVPLDAATLADIDYCRAKLCKMESDHRDFIQALAEKAQQLDNTDARKLECAIEVRDIKLSATALRQYMGIVQNLLDGITGDIRAIFRKRKIFQQSYALHIAKVLEDQKRQESNEKTKERMRKMRAKDSGGETE